MNQCCEGPEITSRIISNLDRIAEYAHVKMRGARANHFVQNYVLFFTHIHMHECLAVVERQTEIDGEFSRWSVSMPTQTKFRVSLIVGGIGLSTIDNNS